MMPIGSDDWLGISVFRPDFMVRLCPPTANELRRQRWRTFCERAYDVFLLGLLLLSIAWLLH